MNTPTTRSLKLLRDEGYTVAVTEHWNAFANCRVDLFGFIDLVAIREDSPGVLGVQTTSVSNISARVEKIFSNPITKIWLKAGNRLEVHGWGKHGARGKRKLWDLTRRPLTLT